MLALIGLCFLCSAVPCVLFCVNLRRYVPPPPVAGAVPAVSILIPARNEAEGIADALGAALASRGVEFEVIVMDDSSTDGTDQVVLGFRDARVRLERAPALPAGWNGKQHACWALAQAARNPALCFVDADVRLEPDCVARMAGFLGENGLVSGFPQQVTGTFLEWMLLPLIHFVLLGFLPIGRMRKGTNPGYAAGCGQFLMCRRDAYFACGGHSGIKLTMHDGLRLPRLFRAAGFRTDLADLTSLARCRMYTNARDTWQGLAKNATEGLGSPGRIVPITLILLLGQVAPFLGVAVMAGLFVTRVSMAEWPMAMWIVLLYGPVLCGPAYLPRFLAAERFDQDKRSAWLHPLGVSLLIAVQWYALWRKVRGGEVSWRGRGYVKTSA